MNLNQYYHEPMKYESQYEGSMDLADQYEETTPTVRDNEMTQLSQQFGDTMDISQPADNTERAVAHLWFRHSKHPGIEKAWAIFRNEQFDVGRPLIEELLGEHEPTISTHHFRLRCVLFEGSHNDELISPMVYLRVLSKNNVELSHTAEDGPEARRMISQDDQDFLLNHNDVFNLTPELSFRFEAEESYAAPAVTMDDIQRAEILRFGDQYRVMDRKLGTGASAAVFISTKQRTNRLVACKIVPVPVEDPAEVRYAKRTLRLHPAQLAVELKAIKRHVLKRREKVAREYGVLKSLSHPNIITLEKVICTTHHTYIFQELITGGDLLSYVDKHNGLEEPQTAVIVRQVLSAVDYLHDNDIVHRDIKPENIMMTSWRDGSRIVLTDFGMSRTFREASAGLKNAAALRMYSMVGTHGYTAPEVFKKVNHEMRNRGYSKAADIFSVGCVAATLLTNEFIFPNQAEKHVANGLADSITEQNAHLEALERLETGQRWQYIGRKAKAFVRGCVELYEDDRLTAKQAFQHRWLAHKQYGKELEQAYQHAIRDWRPREQDENLIEVIDTSDIRKKATQAPEPIKSKFFEDSLPPPPTFPSSSKPSLFKKPAAHKPQQSILPQRKLSNQFTNVEESVVQVPASPEMTQPRLDTQMC